EYILLYRQHRWQRRGIINTKSKILPTPPYKRRAHFSGAVQKCSDARRARNRTARRIWKYVERCGLQRNTADERFLTTHLFSFVTSHYLAKVKSVVIFFRIDSLIIIFIQMNRIYGGFVNYFAFIMNPRYLDDRRRDIPSVCCFQIALLELIHIPARFRSAKSDCLAHISGRYCNRKV